MKAFSEAEKIQLNIIALKDTFATCMRHIPFLYMPFKQGHKAVKGLEGIKNKRDKKFFVFPTNVLTDPRKNMDIHFFPS